MFFVMVSRKKSAPHPGIVHLRLPKLKNVSSIPSIAVDGKSHDTSHYDKRGASELLLCADEENEESSLSVPNSPKVKGRFYQKLSHSCDDLLSEEECSVVGCSRRDPRPSITVTSPKRGHMLDIAVSPSEESMIESGSESELDLYGQSPTNLVAGSKVRRNSADLEARERSSLGSMKSDEERSGYESGGSSGGGKFSRFKGKLLQTVKNSKKSTFLHKRFSRSSQDIDILSKETSSPPKRSPSPVVESETSEVDVAGKKNRFRVNSPGLWRKMRKASSTTKEQPKEEPKEEPKEDLEPDQTDDGAIKSSGSNSRIIYI